MQTSLSAQSFYQSVQKTSCLRISVVYPSSIANLSYNFELTLIIYKQNLLPKITYQKVYSQKYYIAKTEILVNGLQPAKMYKIQVEWVKKGNKQGQDIKQKKTVFVCTLKKHGQNQFQQEIIQENQSFSGQSYQRFVKDNIHSYFNQYYQNDSNQNQRHQSLFVNSKSKSSDVSKAQLIYNRNSQLKTTSKKEKKPAKAPLCNSEAMMKVIGESDSFINKRNLQKYILQGRKSQSVKDYLTTKDFQCFGSFNKVYKNQTQRRKHVQKTLLVSKAINMFGQIYQFERENGILEDTSTMSSVKDKNNNGGKQFFKNDWFMGPFYSYNGNQKKMKNRNTRNQQ